MRMRYESSSLTMTSTTEGPVASASSKSFQAAAAGAGAGGGGDNHHQQQQQQHHHGHAGGRGVTGDGAAAAGPAEGLLHGQGQGPSDRLAKLPPHILQQMSVSLSADGHWPHGHLVSRVCSGTVQCLDALQGSLINYLS